MIRFISLAIVALVLAAEPAAGQTCNMSGAWGGPSLLFNLREGVGGSLTGIFSTGSDAAQASAVTGSRTGTSFTLTIAPGQPNEISAAGTLPNCDTMSFTTPAGIVLSRTSQTYCGNGAIEPGEECDDGNFVNGDVCTVLCTSARCGNHVVEAGETCDDGNLTDGDGCSSVCLPNVCGNSIVESGEECDDGNLINGDGCSTGCRRNICGNGVLEPGEQCDDGNTAPSDTCSPLCVFLGCDVTGRWTMAGFGLVWNLREDGAGNIDGTFGPASGPASAIQPVSGARSGTALTSLALGATGTMVSCDSILVNVPGGYLVPMSRVSTGTYCGDGVIDDPSEQCDDGNFTNGDSCTALCTPAACGNGVVEAPEQCDDGNTTNGDGCSDVCLPNVCGNGIQESGEQCDDSNLVNGDGCSRLCQVNVCGNGIIEPGEECDDSNTVPDDDCSSLCQFQGCNLTGQWQVATTIADLVEDGTGAITGRYYNVGDTAASPVSGSRTGTDVVLIGFNGVVLDCNQIELMNVTPGPVVLTRLSGSRCGDGTRDPGEDCDEGDRLDGDGCNSDCHLPNCGNGSHDPLEECDDGNHIDTDGCKNDCRTNVCGDGTVWTGVEQCDAGAANSNLPDAPCRTDCKARRCGDGVVDAASGEQCDDGNIAIADGCDTQCQVEIITSETVPAGGTLSTDSGGTGATPAAPTQVAVTSPNGGTVTVVATSPVPTSQPGYQLVGKQVNILAPDGTTTAPLRFVFEIDASQIPVGQDETTLAVFRNGVALAECPGSTVALATGPCVTARERLADGDVRITALTAHASTWTLGIRATSGISGAKLSMKAGPVPARRAINFRSKDPSVDLGSGDGSADDPVVHGGELRVRTAAGCAGPCDATYPLPTEHWKYASSAGANEGYKYTDAALASGPIRAGLLKPGQLVKFLGKGALLAQGLDADPAPVRITLRLGGRRWCLVFGGTPKLVVGKSYSTKNAPPALCD